MDNRQRIAKAVEFMEIRLKTSLSLAEIAKAACYSSYHFHRIFHAFTGETIGRYIKRRRLTEAAKALLFSKQRILDIALDFQFESQESFTRAFKNEFGDSPGIYRKKGKVNRQKIRDKIDVNYYRWLKGGASGEPTIKTLKNDMLVYGLIGESNQKNNTLPALWERFSNLCNLHSFPPSPVYGISFYNDCEIFDEYTVFKYMAGIELPDNFHSKERLDTRIIKRGKYAIFTHKGPVSQFVNTMRYILGDWLVRSSFEPDTRDIIEIYTKRFQYEHPDSEIDVWFPVR